MPIKDPFSYSARWDSVGLDCSNCAQFVGPQKWPDKNKTSACALHKISLAIEIGENGYKDGEWFCRDFQNLGTADPKAVTEFEKVYFSLRAQTLYGAYGTDGNLKEVDFQNLLGKNSV